MDIYKNQDKNIWKTWLLMALFLGIVVALGWYFSYLYNSPIILILAVVAALGMNIMSYWYSDTIALKTSGAKPAKETDYPDLHNLVENLAITAGLPKPRIYIITDPAPNAFATGRNPEHAAVAVTTGLLERLEKIELEGVIAHELSHIGNRDILVMSVTVVLVGFVALLSDLFLRMTLFGAMGDRDNRAGLIMILIGVGLAILSPIVATLIRLAISRKREFLADASGSLLTRYPEGLASALEKISGYKGEMKRANHATAHMFISNPFGGKGQKTGFMTRLFMTHPPVSERIAVLRGEGK